MKKYITLLFLSSLSVFPIAAAAKNPGKPAPKMILATPPAPVSTDQERWAELAHRRSEIAAKMADNSMLILFSAEPKLYTNDVDYVYRQENNLYYLTNLKQADAAFVMTKNGAAVKEYLFIPKRDPSREAWEGRMYSNENASQISGLKTIVDSAELESFLQAVSSKKPFNSNNQVAISNSAETLYMLLPSDAEDNNLKREYRHEAEWIGGIAKTTVNKDNEIIYEPTGGYKIANAMPIFDELRHVKSPYELKRLQHAIDITTEAQMRSMAMVGRAKWEYEVHAEVEYIFRKRNADSWGYPSIVGCGANATTLHYVESQSPVTLGNLLLMDVGAEYDHLTADVTRTYPVNGKFNTEQAEIYRIVYNAQESAAALTKPGAKMRELSRAASKTIDEGLAKLGLVTAPGAVIPGVFDEIPDEKGVINKVPRAQYRLWYIHGLGHWLGMNVHDVGAYTDPLKAGMVFTNEPGIYIREDALDYLPDTPEIRAMLEKIKPAFEKYKNIGVRIEDDMLVTETGADWMTKKLPRKLEDIEAFMARAPKEIPYQAASLPAHPHEVFFGRAADSNFWSVTGHTARRGFTRQGGHLHAD
jgi:Xaa-Pro aminopeptidase